MQNVYALGWKANMPEGAEIVARIYDATGITRGALVAEGSAHSSGQGMRWHDVPLCATLAAGFDYDLEVVITNPIEWCLWNDESALPYDAYGVVQVRASEINGNAAIPGLIEVRLHACDGCSRRRPMLPAVRQRSSESAPFPNPVTQRATIQFSLGAAGLVAVAVFDVKGRRVATLLETGERPAGGGSVALDTSGLSSGVYFVRMETRTRMVSQKVTVVR